MEPRQQHHTGPHEVLDAAGSDRARIAAIEARLEDARRSREHIKIWILGSLLCVAAAIYSFGGTMGRTMHGLESLNHEVQRIERRLEAMEQRIYDRGPAH